MDQDSCNNEESAEQIVRFFRQHREEWRRFVSDFLPISPTPPLQALAKFFVIRSNQPFDMQAYMRAQADFIRKSLDSEMGALSPMERQKLVAEWLRNNAQSHRDQIILEQAKTIEQCSALIEPALADLLDGIIPGR
ncbi:MAG TPA: hypothetical protein VN931_05510 [Fibrobacteria bacterium]|nr:hypothetical protein [Fibrobacteria bacterium]